MEKSGGLPLVARPASFSSPLIWLSDGGRGGGWWTFYLRCGWLWRWTVSRGVGITSKESVNMGSTSVVAMFIFLTCELMHEQMECTCSFPS